MQPKKHYFAHIPTIAILYCVCYVGTAGRAAVHLKSIDKNAAKRNGCCAGGADYRSDLGPAPARRRPPGRKTSQPTATMISTKEQKDAKGAS